MERMERMVHLGTRNGSEWMVSGSPLRSSHIDLSVPKASIRNPSLIIRQTRIVSIISFLVDFQLFIHHAVMSDHHEKKNVILLAIKSP